jgi:hypothetical protein
VLLNQRFEIASVGDEVNVERPLPAKLHWGRLDILWLRLRGTFGDWQNGTRNFPDAQLWTAKLLSLTLKKGNLEFTGILTDAPPRADDLEQVPFRGNPLIEEVIFLHRKSRTLILDDLIQNHPAVTGHPLRNALFKLAGVAYPQGSVPLDIRLCFIHRDRARRSLEKLLSWDFDKVIIAHGVCVERNARAFGERAFQWLM